MDSLLVAFVVVFRTEFGKAEILTLVLAAQYGPSPVLIRATVRPQV